LIEMLKDSNSEVKRRAADAIARRMEKRALDELLKYKTYGKAEVRSAIIGAIVAITGAAENERLKTLFQNALYDQDERVKLYAVEGMARHLGTPTALSAITALGGVVIDPSPAVQKSVVEKLGTSKDATATEHLARALFSEHTDVKLAALEAMQANGQENAAKPIQEFIMNEQDPELRQKANDVYDSLP
jgi:HEAT repeat protein